MLSECSSWGKKSSARLLFDVLSQETLYQTNSYYMEDPASFSSTHLIDSQTGPLGNHFVVAEEFYSGGCKTLTGAVRPNAFNLVAVGRPECSISLKGIDTIKSFAIKQCVSSRSRRYRLRNDPVNGCFPAPSASQRHQRQKNSPCTRIDIRPRQRSQRLRRQIDCCVSSRQ